MATLPTVAKSKKLMILKIVFSVTVFLTVMGIMVGISFYNEAKLGEILAKYLAEYNVADISELSGDVRETYKQATEGFKMYIWHDKLNPAFTMPIAFVALPAFMVFKDEIKKYFSVPRGVGVAIVILIISFIIEYIIVYVKVSAATYLFVTLINSLYFDPAIERIEKAEGVNHG